MQLSDYAQALGAAQRLVPGWRDNDLQEAQLQQARLQPQLQQAQLGQIQNQTALATQKAQTDQLQRQSFQADVAALGVKPTADKLYALGIKYPDFAKTINDAAKGVDEGKRVATVRQLAPIQAYIQNGKYDKAAAEVKRHIDADVAAGNPPDETDQELYAELTSGDATRQKAAGGVVYGLIAAVNPDTAAANIQKRQDSNTHVVSQGGALVGDDGTVLYQSDRAPEYRTIQNADGSSSIVQVGGSEGGGQASVGGAARRGSDTSRLINTDAGGGYVPQSVDTLGKFVGWGRALNKNGAKSSSAGTYQINGTTMAEFAPKALGAGWQNAPFNADNQDKVGEAIFNWAKQQPNPATALRGRWVSLSQGQASQLVQGSWGQAKGVIAQGETGGGAGASASGGTGNASVPSAGATGAKILFTSTGNGGASEFRLLSPQEKRDKGLDPGSQFQVDAKGKITPLGRKTELTEGERKATGLLAAMVAATGSLNAVRGYKPSAVALALNDLSNKNPIKANLSQTDRRVLNGQLAFANAILRLESGAAIGKDETANKAQTLFPMPGDGPDVQADKRAQREAALRSMRIASGAGAGEIPKAGSGNGNRQPAAASAPQGGQLIGTFQGRAVYRLPNGKRVVAK